MIIPGSKVLDLACGNGDLLASLECKRGVGIDISPKMIEAARKNHPESQLEFICADIEKFDVEGKFDYIILNGVLGEIEDIQKLFQCIKKFTTSDTRIIINWYNHLWEPVLNFGQKIRLKMPEKIYNWLSVDDIENFLYITGYEPISRRFLLLFPQKIPLLTTVINKFIAKLPIIERLCLVQFIVARVDKVPDNSKDLMVSVVITARDEKENIEGLVQRIPQIGRHTEIIFVEGHSVDGTREEINRMIKKYPEKDIKLLIQNGIGQGDAFRKGFDNASGNFVLWLEADLTTPPEELKNFWDAYIDGKGEYLNGTRMIYEMEERAMPFINFIGNRTFGNLFTWFLGQRFTDTLCGLKGISKRNYLNIRKQMDFFGDFDPFGDFELIFGVIKNNLKVSEIPVKYKPREYGQTKTKPLKHGWLLVRMCLKAFLKFKLF